MDVLLVVWSSTWSIFGERNVCYQLACVSSRLSIDSMKPVTYYRCTMSVHPNMRLGFLVEYSFGLSWLLEQHDMNISVTPHPSYPRRNSWINSKAILRLEGLGKIKRSNDLIRTRTRDFPCCSIVPQPTTLNIWNTYAPRLIIRKVATYCLRYCPKVSQNPY
jgi:hypothetical protein